MKEIVFQLVEYLNSLDWAYIFTLILIVYVLNSVSAKKLYYKFFGLKVSTRYRVLIIGVLYGIIVYFIRDYTINKIEKLLQSFVFALVFHKLLIDKVVRFFSPNIPQEPIKYEQ